MDVFRTAQFLNLKLEWYERLRVETDFRDLEDRRGNLKADIDMRTLNRSMLDKEARETYYAQALHYLDRVAVRDSRDWNIWVHHCDGRSTRQIAEIVQAHPATVQFRIKKMREIANL